MYQSMTQTDHVIPGNLRVVTDNFGTQLSSGFPEYFEILGDRILHHSIG